HHFPIHPHPRRRKPCHGILHHSPHVLHSRRTHFRDGGFHSGNNLRFSGGLGQISFDQYNLSRFFVRHFLPTALGELLDGLFALFDQRSQNLLRFFVIEWSHLLHFFILEGALDHAQGGELLLRTGFHCLSNIFLNLFNQAHE